MSHYKDPTSELAELAGLDELTAELSEENEVELPEENGFIVHESDINNKKGNYIFTVGNVGSGKSTLQNIMIYRLFSAINIDFSVMNHYGDERHDYILNQWISNIKKGVLPERSKQGVLQEFNISISQKNKRKLNLNFLEISGEDIKSIVPTFEKDHKAKINALLENYLKLKRINKKFIFISDASKNRKIGMRTAESEDILFNHFLHYLLTPNGLNLKRIDVLFVASKWDLVKTEYRSVSQYFNQHLPQTMSILNSNKCHLTMMPFSIGEVTDQRITSLESIYIERLIQWIYYNFTYNQLIKWLSPC